MTSAISTQRITSLAVVDLTGNPGGGARFVRSLIPALQRARPELRTSFFGTPESIGRDDMGREFAAAGIQVNEVQWIPERPWRSRPLRTRAGYKLRRRLGLDAARVEEYIAANFVKEISGSELAYFPWPFRLAVPALNCPIVTTIHDLNFEYFFGVPSFADALQLEAQIGEWVRVSRAVASSLFMAEEIARFYPGAGRVQVIRLAPFAGPHGKTPRDMGGPSFREVRTPYLLCPTQVSVHKNTGPLIAALAILRERFPDLRLVLTGMGTELATGRATSIGSMRANRDPDVIGLGYVSNLQIDHLIEHAAVVVNPSLYEAGNGPGLDAWSLGTPVAMSDIPAFREHLDALGVEAALFDPRDPRDIAAKISEVLEHDDAWAEVASRSRAAIARRSWDDVAAEYLQVFDATYSEHDLG